MTMTDARAITGRVTFTVLDHLRARANRNTAGLIAVMIAIVAIIAVFENGVPELDSPVAFVIDALAGVMAIAGLFLAYVVFLALVIVALSSRLSKEQRNVTYELGQDSVLLRDETGATSTLPWTIVRRASESRAAFRLYLRPLRAIYFPKRAFAPQDIPALRALLSDKLGARAKLAKG